MVASQVLEVVEHLLGNQVALLNPALQACSGAYLDKTLLPIEHHHLLAVLHAPDFVVDLGDAVSQKDLWGGNIHRLSALPVAVTCRSEGQGQQEYGGRPSTLGDGFHRVVLPI